MLTWEEALLRTTRDEASVQRMMTLPLNIVTRDARNGNLESLNFLLRHSSMHIIAKQCATTCSQMHHRARPCTGLFCEGAMGSCVEVATDAIFGVSANLAEQPHRSVAITLELDDFHAEDVRRRNEISSPMGRSVLEYWDNNLDAKDNPSEVWLRQITRGLKRPGWLTDCRRKWNQTRGLPQRIDQANYFRRGDSVTTLGHAFFLEWNSWLSVLSEKNPESTKLILLPSFHTSDAPALKHEIHELVTWLGAIYDDACETWEVGNLADYLRIARNLAYRGTIKAESPFSEELIRGVEATCLLIEASLNAAYESLRSEPTILNAINRAREVTRILENVQDSDLLVFVHAKHDSSKSGQR